LLDERPALSLPVVVVLEKVSAPSTSSGTGAKTHPSRNPNGYCGLGGTGVSCPVGLARTS
jgi:hypothetical protein